jgi:hypothetical protein
MVARSDQSKLLWEVASGVVDYWTENCETVTMESVFSRSCRRSDREARVAIMFAAKELLGCSCADIGRFLNRDRSTVARDICSVTFCWDIDERELMLASVGWYLLDSQLSELELSESAGA